MPKKKRGRPPKQAGLANEPKQTPKQPKKRKRAASPDSAGGAKQAKSAVASYTVPEVGTKQALRGQRFPEQSMSLPACVILPKVTLAVSTAHTFIFVMQH